MANEAFTAIQTTVATPGFDADNDGVIDPGEQVTTTVTITNNSTNPTPVNATGVQFTEDLQGMTLVNQAGDDINASPIAFDDSYTAAGNVAFTGVAMLNNDAEPLGPEGLALNAGTAIQNTGVAFATTQGGSVTLNANGTFTYVSAVGFEGVDTFTYTLRDTGLDAVAGNADDLSGTGTVSITVGPSVWFIDNNAAGSTNVGTQANPFTSIAAFNAAQGTANGPDSGDFVYLRHGTGTYSEANGINLANGQTLVGQGQNLVVNGVTIEVGSGGLIPTIQVTGADEGVLLAQNNTLSGFNISTTNAAADGIEDGGGTVGTLTISNVSIAGTGQAVDIDQGGTLNVTLASVTSTGSSEEGIQLAGVAGSFTASTVSLNGMTGDGIDLDNNSATVAINGGTIGNSNDPGGIGVDINVGTGNVTIGATINKTTAGDVVEVTGRTTGTVDFNGNITSTNGGGIDLTGSSGGTIRFDGGMNLSTGATTAFNATGNTGMTLVVTDPGAGSNILTTTTGTALNVANTTIGTEDLTFQSISSSGGSATGIILDTTGTGGLHVTGNGSAGTGGTIANKTGADGSTSTGVGIYLNNASDVQLDWMQLNDLQNFGIRGNNVTGFSFDNSVISGTNGTAAGAFDEAAISFNNLLGSASISDSNIGNGFEYILKVLNSSGTLNRLTIDNTDFGTNNTALGGDAVQIVASNTATVNVTVTDSGFTNAREDLFNAVATQSADMDVVFRDNTLSNNHTNKVSAASNILVFSTSNGDVTYDISHNTLTSGATGSSIAVAKGVPDTGSGGTMTGTVNANTIGVSGVVGSGSEFTGIFASALGSGTHTTAITNNTIYHYNEEGIFLKANDPLTGGNSVLNATVTGNITTEPDSLAFAGLWVLAGSGSGTETNTVNVVLGNVSNAALQNDFTNGDPANGSDVFLQESGSGSVINLSRAGSAAGTAAGVIQDDNVGTPTVVAAGTVNLVNTLPPTPPPVAPLLAATGGVEAAPPADSAPPADTTPPQENAGGPGTGDQPPSTQPVVPATTIVNDGVLSQAELDTMVDAAIARWSTTGLTAEQVAALHGMTFTVGDMSGLNLGSFSPTQITLDADAAGRGWYLDGTPLDDAEFGTIFSTTWMQTTPTGAPAGHYDLLTTIMHEMGHTLGLGDSYASADRNALMYGWLFTGERRLPGTGDADGAVAGSITSEEFLGAPVDIGVLPAGKQVIIQWQATIDPQSNGLIVNPVNTGTVTATNGVGFPDTNTNTVTTTLDTLILGGTIWNDNGAGGGTAANGLRDGTEPGVGSVLLTLFADTGTTAGVWDAGDTQIATASTAGNGDYSFLGLAPGEYIVRVDAGNFTGSGALAGLLVSPVTSPEPPDPDDNIDNDDNGSRVADQPAFSNAITLAYNTEPTAGTGNDTNTTLDFGFFNNPIQVVKFVNGQDADSPPGLHVAAGSTLTFTYVVTDTGTAPLANVAVTDDRLGPITSFTGDTNGNGMLDPTETWVYTQTATAVVGHQFNVGTVTAQDTTTGTTVTDGNSANYFGDAPAINIVKFVNGQDADSPTGPHVAAGSTVTFTYVVTDTGNVPLANIVVTDDKLGAITGVTGDTNANGLLDLTETWVYTHTATALAGQQNNVGTVTAQDADISTTVTDDNPANYFGDGAPAINIVKFVNGQDADSPTGPHVAVGSILTFTYVVTDSGNVPLANVAVTDDKLGAITSFTGDTNANGLLDQTETWVYTHTATAVAGQQTNVGNAIAQDSTNLTTTVTDSNTANYFGDAPAIHIVKFVNGQDANSPTGPHVAVGSTVTFTYVVTDSGNVPLANVLVTDDKLGAITSFTGDTNANGLLDLTETWIYTHTATALSGQQTNTGAVAAQDTTTGTMVSDFNVANYFGGTQQAANDFDADSKSDILWQSSNGTAAAWLMDGTTSTFVGAIGPFNPGPSWHVKATGDLNGDGKDDILWQHDNGAAALWLMDGTDVTFAGQIGPFNPGPNWEIEGTGDFNGDGKDDIIWQHDNGLTAMWLMDGSNATFVGAVGQFNPEALWDIKATGDFNGDGKDDIIWQHDNGAAAVWLMDGTNATFAGAVGAFNPGPSWEIKGSGDFNGDSKADILWQNDDGTPAIWLMDGTNVTFAGAVGPFNPGPSWHIEGAGDFNGDGKDDILWQNDDGTPAIWLMDGQSVTDVTALPNPGSDWHIVV